MRFDFPSSISPSKKNYVFETNPPSYTFQPFAEGGRLGSAFFKLGRTTTRLMQLDFPDYADYLASLAVYVADHPECLNDVRWWFKCPIDDCEIAFAARVIWTEKDTAGLQQRYYSLPLKKISRQKSCRWDRRFERMEPWMDGSYNSIVLLLGGERSALCKDLSRYLQLTAIRNWVKEQRDKTLCGNMPHPLALMEWSQNWNEQRAFDLAVEAVQQALGIHQSRTDMDATLRKFINYAMVNRFSS